MRRISPGDTDVTLYVFVPNSAQTDGRGLTGLAFNTASLACYYVRAKGSATAITLATQTVTGNHSDGGFVEVDATNMPGVYRLDLPDAVVATGVDEAAIILRGASNMAPVTIGIDLRWQLGYVPWVEFTASGTPTTTSTDAALGTLSAGIAADLTGAMLVVQTGNRAGERVRVTSVSESGGTLTFTHEALSGAMAANDIFSVEHAKTQKSGTGNGEVSLSAGLVRLSGTAIDDIVDEVIEGSTTFRQLLRGFASALLAKASGLEGTNPLFRDLADSKNRINATVDANGNRTAVTLDLT